jgi:hypothetical protein
MEGFVSLLTKFLKKLFFGTRKTRSRVFTNLKWGLPLLGLVFVLGYFGVVNFDVPIKVNNKIIYGKQRIEEARAFLYLGYLFLIVGALLHIKVEDKPEQVKGSSFFSNLTVPALALLVVFVSFYQNESSIPALTSTERRLVSESSKVNGLTPFQVEKRIETFNTCSSSSDCRILPGIENGSCYYLVNQKVSNQATSFIESIGSPKAENCTELSTASGVVCVNGKCVFGEGSMPETLNW